jgi:hypothetical protein
MSWAVCLQMELRGSASMMCVYHIGIGTYIYTILAYIYHIGMCVCVCVLPLPSDYTDKVFFLVFYVSVWVWHVCMCAHIGGSVFLGMVCGCLRRTPALPVSTSLVKTGSLTVHIRLVASNAHNALVSRNHSTVAQACTWLSPTFYLSTRIWTQGLWPTQHATLLTEPFLSPHLL